MIQVLLVRPGSTDYDQQARIQGRLDIPLSEKGQQEALKLAEKVRIHAPKALYCSPCANAEATGKIIGQALSLKPKSVETLENMNLGLWQGLLVEDVRRKQTKVYKQWAEHPETIRPPEGETIGDVTERVDEALEKLAKKHKTGAVAVVAPEPLASIIRQRITQKEIGDLWHAANGCEQVEVLNFDPDAPKLAAGVNGTATAATPEKNGKNQPQNGENGVSNGANKPSTTMYYRGSVVHRA